MPLQVLPFYLEFDLFFHPFSFMLNVELGTDGNVYPLTRYLDCEFFTIFK